MSDTSRRITPDRQHTLGGKKNLDWFFANRKWIRTAGNSVVEAAWAKRDLPEGETAIRFLFMAAKKSYKRAHDRNQIKRWLRAAITEVAGYANVERVMAEKNQQILVMLRISKAMEDVSWDSILTEVRLIAEHLQKRTTPSTEPVAPLITKAERERRNIAANHTPN